MLLRMKKGKSCGCLIASNVISLEIERRKKKLELKRLKNSVKKAKEKEKILKLKKEEKEAADSLRSVRKHKESMKQRFEDYVKKSGYVPPKMVRKNGT